MHGIFHVVSRFPQHFMLYCGNLDDFSSSENVRMSPEETNEILEYLLEFPPTPPRPAPAFRFEEYSLLRYSHLAYYLANWSVDILRHQRRV